MEKVITVRPEPGEVLPSLIRVMRRAGSPKDASREIETAARQAIAMLSGLAEPAGFYRIIRIERVSEREVEADGLRVESADMARRLGGSELVSVLLGTVGAGPEEECASLWARGEHTLSLFLDSAASEMTEALLRLVHRKACDKLSGFRGTARYAPGYGDFSLKHQEPIVKLLGGEKTGVRVMEDSFMLTPRKSATAIVGWKRLEN